MKKTIQQLDQTQFALVKGGAVYPGGMLCAVFTLPGVRIGYVYSTLNARWEIVNMQSKHVIAVQVQF
jgi:hypothetical protein